MVALHEALWGLRKRRVKPFWGSCWHMSAAVLTIKLVSDGHPRLWLFGITVLLRTLQSLTGPQASVVTWHESLHRGSVHMRLHMFLSKRHPALESRRRAHDSDGASDPCSAYMDQD